MLNKEFLIISRSDSFIKIYIDGTIKVIRLTYSKKIAAELEILPDNKHLSKLIRQVMVILKLKVIANYKNKLLYNIQIINEPIDKLLDNLKNNRIRFVSASIIINLHNYVLIIPKGMCAYCAVRRIVYCFTEIYAHKQLWKLAPFPIQNQYKLVEYIQNAMKRLNTNKIAIIEKKTHKLHFDNLISFSDCPICYPNAIHDTGIVKIHDLCNSINNENGTRSIQNAGAIKKLNKNIGIMHPVNFVYKVNHMDKLNMPVFEAKIGIDPIKFGSGFMLHGGKGKTALQARCSAIGEGIERYNAQFFSNEQIVSASYNDIVKKHIRAINPQEFSEDNKISADIVIDWNWVCV